jgi:predicted nuclease of predicted toxin-antitoxin system
MQVLVDMNLSPGWVGYLTEAGFEAIHWSDVGPGSAPDEELMLWAAERNYIVLTADLDFGAILAATQRRRPSVVQVRSDLLTPQAIGSAVVVALRQAQQELLDGALVSVDPVRARLRILPIR